MFIMLNQIDNAILIMQYAKCLTVIGVVILPLNGVNSLKFADYSSAKANIQGRTQGLIEHLA